MSTQSLTCNKRGGLTRRERAMLWRYLHRAWSIQRLAEQFHAAESDIKRELGTALLKVAGEQGVHSHA